MPNPIPTPPSLKVNIYTQNSVPSGKLNKLDGTVIGPPVNAGLAIQPGDRMDSGLDTWKFGINVIKPGSPSSITLISTNFLNPNTQFKLDYITIGSGINDIIGITFQLISGTADIKLLQTSLKPRIWIRAPGVTTAVEGTEVQVSTDGVKTIIKTLSGKVGVQLFPGALMELGTQGLEVNMPLLNINGSGTSGNYSEDANSQPLPRPTPPSD